MQPLNVDNLCKAYASFTLKDVSFSLTEGKITGFIGRNGAGKTTTLKCLLNLVHPDDGSIAFFGEPFLSHEQAIKGQIGFVMGGIDYYLNKKLRTITSVTKAFYPNWEDATYKHYMDMFQLDESKTPAQLSQGMRVKYALALALSHQAKLLILDEPTSGLDPISRDQLLDIFLSLQEKGITIFFSTHITSDLDKCADNILYIRNGSIIADMDLNDFIASYQIVQVDSEASSSLQDKIVGLRRTKAGQTALLTTSDVMELKLQGKEVNLEEIMVHMEKEEAV